MRPLVSVEGRKARMALFLSGGGSNAREILARLHAEGGAAPLEAVVLVTDHPQGSGAQRLGQEYGVPVVGHDVRAFYRARGLARVGVSTAEGWAAREAWTEALRVKLRPYAIDFAVFAGFELLSNISVDYPCLNVHPGDLAYLRDGRRYLVGLHTVPVERALLAGLTELRASVLVVTPYSGRSEDMDAGPLLGVSPPVPVDLGGHTLKELAAAAARRPAVRPRGGYGDILQQVAAHNQERLKEGGDWVVFPPVVWAAARGRYWLGDAAEAYYREARDGPLLPAARLVFSSGGGVAVR